MLTEILYKAAVSCVVLHVTICWGFELFASRSREADSSGCECEALGRAVRCREQGRSREALRCVFDLLPFPVKSTMRFCAGSVEAAG